MREDSWQHCRIGKKVCERAHKDLSAPVCQPAGDIQAAGTFKRGDLRDCDKEQFTPVGGDGETRDCSLGPGWGAALTALGLKGGEA